MTFTPPDPGAVATHLDTGRREAAALGELADRHDDDQLRAAAEAVALATRILERRLRSLRGASQA